VVGHVALAQHRGQHGAGLRQPLAQPRQARALGGQLGLRGGQARLRGRQLRLRVGQAALDDRHLPGAGALQPRQVGGRRGQRALTRLAALDLRAQAALAGAARGMGQRDQAGEGRPSREQGGEQGHGAAGGTAARHDEAPSR
jgi:hypothetical protein